MRVSAVLVVATGLVAGSASAEVKVTTHGSRMDIIVTKATVSDILDGISKQTGMKVIFDGPRPPREITKSIVDRTPADAVLGILEGEGLNFAVILNPAGTQIETLLVTGASAVRSSPVAPPAGAGGAAPAQPEWAVDVDVPPPPPPPPPPPGADENAPPPPPGGAEGAQTAAPPPAAATAPPLTLPTPTPPPSSTFTPTGPGPVLFPTPPSPYH